MQSKTPQLCSAEGLRVALVVSTYHRSVTERLSVEAKNTFVDAGGVEDDCTLFHAQGAWELPVLAKKLANENCVDAIIALGCIITGETTHDRIIGDAIAHGLMNVALDWGHPVSMGVLTCQSLKQAEERSGGSCGNKGAEAMRAAIGTAVTLKELSP
jgi:6,7-dimethyl-8-ribityllumazine synthase